MDSLGSDYRAIVIGSTGGIGAAVLAQLESDPNCGRAVGLSRQSNPPLDLLDESSIEVAAASLKNQAPFRLIFDATGILHDETMQPEKTINRLDPALMARSYAVNAIGPALLFKHFHALLPRRERSLFATISARVGSVGDNRLGGWISYRAAKAALNQIVKTASLEIAFKRPEAICIALQPGTVATRLSEPYAGSASLLSPQESAGRLLSVIDNCTQTGSFLDHRGDTLPW